MRTHNATKGDEVQDSPDDLAIPPAFESAKDARAPAELDFVLEGTPSARPRDVSAPPTTFDTLVVLGSSLTALAVIRDAHEQPLHTVVVDSDFGPAFLSRWPVPVFLGFADDSTSLEKIIGVSGPSAALIATSDRWLRFLVTHRTQIDSAFGAVLHPENDALRVCLDKLEFARWCVANALPTPLSWIGGIEGVPDTARFPLFVRPAETMHSMRTGARRSLPKAVEVHDQQTLNEWLARFAEADARALVSESLLGRDLEQWSVGFSRGTAGLSLFTARKIRPSPERCATGSYVEMCPDPDIEALGRAAVERLGYFGIGEVEILRDRSTGERYLIEINARPWLQYALAPASGHDFLGELLGNGTRKESHPVKRGRVWINGNDDLMNTFSRSLGQVRNGKSGLLDYARSLLKVNVFAVFDVRDPVPFLKAIAGRYK